MIGAAAIGIAAFLLAFLVVPVAAVFYTAFVSGSGTFTLAHFESFFQISLMRESFWNSLYVAGMSVVFASLIAVRNENDSRTIAMPSTRTAIHQSSSGSGCCHLWMPS